MVRFIMLVTAFFLLNIKDSLAQYSADKDAAYLATIKAVADYKLNDEETLHSMNRLRQDAEFNRKLYEMIQKLSNSQNRDSKNERVYKILKQAGKDIYNILK